MLRLGIKKKTTGGKEYPSEVDYFILDPEAPDPAEKLRLIKLFEEEFGKEPKSISIMLRHSEIDEAFPQNYKRYGRNTALKCIGDGKTALCTDPQFAEGLEIESEHPDRKLPIVKCLGRNCKFSVVNEKATNKECKATATLSVEIPALGGIGVWQITTGSFNSILNINGFIRDMMHRFGRAHMLPLTLERREIETIFKGKKAKHYPLYMNTDKSMTEMMKQLSIAPERVLIETYGEQVKELPPPAEIMDAESTEIPAEEAKALVINCPPVGDPELPQPAEVRHQGEASLPGEPSKLPEPHPMTKDPEEAEIDRQAANDEVKETVGKAVEAFDGKPADKESKEFLDGLKEDGKVLDKPYDASVEGDGYKKPEKIQSPQNKMTDMPENFFEFMTKAKAMLKKAEKEDMYKDALHTYSIKVLSDVKDDQKKQADVRAYVEALLEEEGVV
jgi:hypothetical protein